MWILVYRVSFLIFLISLGGISKVNAQWKKIKETDQLVIYQDNSIDTIRHFKATFFPNTTLFGAEKYLTDIQNYQDWISPLDEIRLVHSASDSVKHCYFSISVRPVFHRDGILVTQVEHDIAQDRVTYQIKLDKTYRYPEPLDPPKYFQMDWEMQQLNEKQLQVDMYYIGYSRAYNSFVKAILDEVIIMAVQSMVTDVMTAMTGE